MATTLDAAARARRGGSPIAHLVTDRGQAFTLVNTPETASISGITPVFTQVPRPGRKPLTVQDSLDVEVLTFTHTIAGVSNVPALISSLRGLARSGHKVRMVGFDLIIRGWFNITTLTVAVKRLDVNQKVVQADLTWTLTETVLSAVQIGRPVPALTQKQLDDIATRQQPGTRSTTSDGGTRYRTKEGDTLRKIAETQLGDPNRWQEIASLNIDVLNAANTGFSLDPKILWRRAVMGVPAGLLLKLPAPSSGPTLPSAGSGRGGRVPLPT